MANKSRLTLKTECSTFLDLGENLLLQPDTASQCRYITSKVSGILGKDTSFWFASPHYPLPGQSGVDILQPGVSPLLALNAAQKKKIQFKSVSDSQGQKIITSVALPFLFNHKLLGVMLLETPEGSALSEADIRFATQFASHSASALETFRQISLNRYRVQQLGLVRKVSSQVVKFMELDELCKQVARLIQQTFHYYFVAIFTVEGNNEQLKFRASASTHFLDIQEFQVRMGRGMVGLAAKFGEELCSPDVSLEPKYQADSTLPETRSEVVIPLIVEGRIMGVLDVQGNKINAFHEVDLLVLRTLADSIALAIEDTRLFQDLKWRSDQLDSIIKVSRAITSILDLNTLLDQVLINIQNLFPSAMVCIYSVAQGRNQIRLEAGSPCIPSNSAEKIIGFNLIEVGGVIPRVVHSRKIYQSLNLASEDQTIFNPHHDPFNGSRLVIPLAFGSSILGVLDIYQDKEYAFNLNDVALLNGLSSSIAIAMRNATLYSSEQWRRKVAESFKDVAGLISDNIAVDKLLKTILQKLRESLPCEVSAVWLVKDPNQDDKSFYVAASDGISEARLDEIYLASPQMKKRLDSTLNSGEVSIRQQLDPYGPLGIACNYPPDYSSVAAPLIAGDELLGVITLAVPEPSRYGQETLTLISTFADYAAIAIQNTRLFEESQVQTWVSSVLLQIAQISQSINEIDELFTTMAKVTPLLVGVNKCAFLLWDEDCQCCEIKSVYGYPESLKEICISMPDTPALAAIKTSNALASAVISPDLCGLPLDFNQDDDSSLVLLPLQRGDNFLGGVFVSYKRTSQVGSHAGIDDKTLAILEGLVRQMSTTLENLQLQKARQEEAYTNAVLLDAAKTIAAETRLNDILDNVFQLLPASAGIPSGIVYLWQAAKAIFYPFKAFGFNQATRDVLLYMSFRSGRHSLLDQVLSTGQIHSCKFPDDIIFTPENLSRLKCQPFSLDDGPSSRRKSMMIGMPLSYRDEFFGVILFQLDPFTPVREKTRMDIVQGIAQQITMAMQNDRYQDELLQRQRIDQEMQLAEEIQKNFLPQSLPGIDGWEFDSRWIPARRVGGDFYDVIRLSEGIYGLVIADVSDKSLPAALYMTVTRSLLRANLEIGSQPAQVLEKVNRSLIFDTDNSMFVTAVLGILDVSRNEMTYAIAGHSPPLIHRSRENRVEQLSGNGLALGVIEDLRLENQRVTVEKGDLILFYTDGVTEAFSPTEEQFGKDRLIEIVCKNSGSVLELNNDIEKAIQDFRRQAPPSDDLTLLGLKKL